MIMLQSTSAFLVRGACRVLQADGPDLSKELDPMASRDPFQPNYSKMYAAFQRSWLGKNSFLPPLILKVLLTFAMEKEQLKSLDAKLDVTSK